MRAAFRQQLALGAILLGLAWTAAAAETEWRTRFDEQGLRVETRGIAGSNYEAFRASIFITASPDEILARIRDVDGYPDWFPDTIEARRVELIEDRWANYVRTDVPWPVKDRDAIYTQSLERSATSITIIVGVAPDALPESVDAVRVREAAGRWDLAAVDGGTDLRWEFHIEPGGNVPSGLANARIAETPKRALQALRAYFSNERQ